MRFHPPFLDLKPLFFSPLMQKQSSQMHVLSKNAHIPRPSSPGSLSHLGTIPGSARAGLSVAGRAGRLCSSWADVPASPGVSWLGGGSAETAELPEGSGDRSMHLWLGTREKGRKITGASLDPLIQVAQDNQQKVQTKEEDLE